MMKGILLAAGLGTRFQPFTTKIPKPCIPLLNVPIAFYNLHLVQQLGIEELVVNTHHLPLEIEKLFSNEHLISMPVHFSHEVKEILGTGGAILHAWKFLKGSGTFVVANADVVNGFTVHDALAFHVREKPLATMVVMKHPEAGKRYGAVWLDDQMKVVDISLQKPPVACEPFHFVGVHFIEERISRYIPQGKSDINRHVYLSAIKNGETVFGFEKEGLWFDAGSLTDYLSATRGLLELLPRLQHEPYFLSLFRRFWKGFENRPNLWEGENCEHLLTLGSTVPILMGSGCRIHPATRVEGFAVFGNNVVIEKNVELKNTVLGSSVRIAEGQKLSNTLIL